MALATDAAVKPTASGLRTGCCVQVIGQENEASSRRLLGQLQKVDSKVLLLNGQTVFVEVARVQAPKDLRKPIEGGDEASFDMLLGPQTSDAVLAEEMSACLFEKGFCVLKVCQSLTDTARAVEVLHALGEDGTLGRLPEEVEEGYLGSCGRGKVMWLDPDKLETVHHQVLRACDQNLSYLASVLQPCSSDALGAAIDERTPALVSLSFDSDEEEDYPQPVADDKLLGDFLGTWRRGLVRVIHFL
ncbi:unnamed protein product, partial [Polarella glacialis]